MHARRSKQNVPTPMTSPPTPASLAWAQVRTPFGVVRIQVASPPFAGGSRLMDVVTGRDGVDTREMDCIAGVPVESYLRNA
jgi:hypothetical protein